MKEAKMFSMQRSTKKSIEPKLPDQPVGSYFPIFADFSCFGMFFDNILKSMIDREKVKEAKMFNTQRSTKSQ